MAIVWYGIAVYLFIVVYFFFVGMNAFKEDVRVGFVSFKRVVVVCLIGGLLWPILIAFDPDWFVDRAEDFLNEENFL